MSFTFDSGFSEVTTQDEAAPGTAGSAAPVNYLPPTDNYAEDDKVKRQIAGELVPIIDWCRQDRMSQESEWGAIRNMESLTHDEGRRYYGRSDAYLPIYARILGTAVSSLGRGLFPSDEYMDVADRGTGDPERSRPLKAYLQWEFETNAKLRSHMRPFLRQLGNFGNSVLKAVYRKEVMHQGRAKRPSARDLFSQVRLGGTQSEFKPTAVHDGLQVSARNLFSWYVYPNTVESISEAQVIFEDSRTSRLHIKEMGFKGLWKNIEAAIAAPNISQKDNNDALQNLAMRGSGANASDQFGANEIGGYVTLTEVWAFLHLPPGAYLPDEDKRLPLPVRVVLAGGTPVLVIRNPYFHQRPPYLVARDNVNPGYFYGSGAGRMVRWMQYLSNDMANQTNDVGIMGLNPMIKVNPGTITGPLPPIVPGGIWYTTDPQNGIVFDRPPIEQIQFGLMLLNQWMSSSFDLAGAPPILQGSGRGGKTATSSQILQRNAMIPYQDTVEGIELDVMVPLMFLTWVNAQQFRDQDVMAMVAGNSMKVSPEQLCIDPEFRWLASSQATNNQMRTQQAMSLIQAISPIVPLLMQQGYTVDFVPLLKRIYGDGMGFRGFQEFIRPAMGGMAGGMPTPGGMNPGVQQQQGDSIRSALDQLGGGPVEMVPGEGEDFMAVRSEADEMASMMGAMGGGLQ